MDYEQMMNYMDENPEKYELLGTPRNFERIFYIEAQGGLYIHCNFMVKKIIATTHSRVGASEWMNE